MEMEPPFGDGSGPRFGRIKVIEGSVVATPSSPPAGGPVAPCADRVPHAVRVGSSITLLQRVEQSLVADVAYAPASDGWEHAQR